MTGHRMPLLLCLAKIKGACEIKNIQRRRVTCYMDENRLVRSFGEGQVYSGRCEAGVVMASIGQVQLIQKPYVR
jgi:hypothetical protein